YGWALFFVIGSGSIATLSAAFARYIQQFVVLSALSAKLVSLAVILVVAGVNVRGTRQGAVVQNWSTAIKVGALLLLSALLLATGSGLASTQVRVLATPLSTELLRGIAVAMVAVLWASGVAVCHLLRGRDRRAPTRVCPRHRRRHVGHRRDLPARQPRLSSGARPR